MLSRLVISVTTIVECHGKFRIQIKSPVVICNREFIFANFVICGSAIVIEDSIIWVPLQRLTKIRNGIVMIAQMFEGNTTVVVNAQL